MTTRSELPRALVIAIALAIAAPARAQPTPEPPGHGDERLQLRDRFREGLEKYQAGKFGEAILVWNPIYQVLGPQAGYRLAFNLGRAYDQIHDDVRAADHYDVYLAEIEVRQNAGESLEANVLTQRDEALERMTELSAKLVRIRFRGAAEFISIDGAEVRRARGNAHVMPGKHVVVYRPGTEDEARIEIDGAGGLQLDLETPAVVPKPVVPPPAPPPMRWETHVERPFPKSVIYVGAGATALSFLIPPLLYANAQSTFDEYASDESKVGLRDDYSSQKTAAYASWAIPALLGTATVALALYWYYGDKTVRTPVAGTF